VYGDCGLFLDESWSVEQLGTFTALARQACDALSKRDKIPADEIQSWQMINGDDVTCFTFFGQSESLFWMAEGELSDVESEVGEVGCW
jgi:hypothetical protein